MRSYQILSVLFALSIPSSVFAVPKPAETDDASSDPLPTEEQFAINHSELESNRLSAELGSNDKVAALSAPKGGKCIDITFTSENPKWNYYFNGGWGMGSGNVGQLKTKSLCGSGAMFVGQQTREQGLGSAAGGNTKLECTVTGSGKRDSVCNVSVVDGYSLSMHCTGFGSGDIGGTKNLFDLGKCPRKNPIGPTCVNTRGHTNNALQFFKNGGKYWFQDNVFVGTTFQGTPKVTCHIGK